MAEPYTQMPGQLSTVQKIQMNWFQLRDRFATFRNEMIRDYEYIIGNQIDADVITKLESQGRPVMVFNLLQPVVLYMAGNLASNKRVFRAVPKRRGDERLAEVRTVLVNDYAMANCNGYEEIVKAAVDAMICKVGWTNNYMDYSEDPEGKWKTEVFDPFMIMWDPDAKKNDQSDWRYYAVSGWYGAEEIIAMIPDMPADLVEQMRLEASRIEGIVRAPGKPIGWVDRVIGSLSDYWKSRRSLGTVRSALDDMIDGAAGLYRVIEWHEKRITTSTLVYSPLSREAIPAPEDQMELSMMMQQIPGAKIQTVTTSALYVTTICPALVPDMPLVEQPYGVQGAGFQHKPIFCYDLHPDKLQTKSVLDSLIGAQDSFNQRRMTQLETLMDTVNPKWNAPENSIGNVEEWQNAARGDVRFYRRQGGDKPEPDRPTAQIQWIDKFAEEDRALIDMISQITPNMKGFEQSANEPASLYRQRVEQGMTTLQFFNMNLTLAMRQIFRYCDKSLARYMTAPKMIRLLSEPPSGMMGVEASQLGDGQLWWLAVNWPSLQGVINDMTTGEFDYEPDMSKIGQTARQLQLLEAIEFVNVMPPELVYWPKLFELWDSPIAADMGRFAEMQMGTMLLQQQVAARQEVEGKRIGNRNENLRPALEAARGGKSNGSR